jgi:hypothetical protein
MITATTRIQMRSHHDLVVPAIMGSTTGVQP